MKLKGGTKTEPDITMNTSEERQPERRASEPSNDPIEKKVTDIVDHTSETYESMIKRNQFEQMEKLSRQTHEIVAQTLHTQLTQISHDGNARFKTK